MIIAPTSKEQWNLLAQFLNEYAGVAPSADLKTIAWATDNKIHMVVGFNAFLGKVCQMHVAMARGFHFTPKEMLRACFVYVFDTMKCEKVLGIVNSNNVKAIRYDEHLGFVEEHRMPGMHDYGGDIVIFGMTKAQCRYMKEGKDADLRVA